MHKNSRVNLIQAVGLRVFTVAKGVDQVVPPLPQPGHVSKELGSFRNRLVTHVGRIQPISQELFLEGYVGRKRRNYGTAVESLRLEPIKEKDFIINSFIKDDKVMKDKCPRVIQPRSMRANVKLGCHLKPMEKAIFGGIAAVYKSRTVFKGMNADQRGAALQRKWNRFNKPLAIMLDAKRFDQHCSTQIINWEHHLWESMAGEPHELHRLNLWRKVNKCYARAHDGGIKYSVAGGRMSGDMDTALGNCTTMCVMMWSFLRKLGIKKFEFANDGDDGVLMVEKSDGPAVLDAFYDYFLALGFQMKLEGVTPVFEEIEFCQSRPIEVNGSYRMVRDPRVCIAKDALCLRNYRNVEEYELFRSNVGHCGMALAGDMPIYSALYRKFITQRDERDTTYATGMQFLAHGMGTKTAAVTDETRVSFWVAYDICPDEQIAIETLIFNTDFSINVMPVVCDVLPSIYHINPRLQLQQ